MLNENASVHVHTLFVSPSLCLSLCPGCQWRLNLTQAYDRCQGGNQAGNCRVEDLVNGSDIHPSQSVPTIMGNVYSEQSASVIDLSRCVSSFVALGVNIDYIYKAYLRSFLLCVVLKKESV